MVTAVSGFIEQVGSMIKEIPKHNYYLSPPSQVSKSYVAETLVC